MARTSKKAKAAPTKKMPIAEDEVKDVDGFQILKTNKKTVEQYSLTEELLKLNETIMQDEHAKCSCLGTTSLTFPSQNNSVRTEMFTSHVNQFLNLEHPEPPFVFTTAENVAGKYSNSYLKTKENLTVYRKVVKYEGIIENPTVYMIFVYDKKNDMYDVIERSPCTNLMENFGFNMNNEEIDRYSEGDKIKKDTVIYKSGSYDEYMNYGYGMNAIVGYTLDPFTSEDAAFCSETFAKKMTSIETEPIEIKLNDNDVLLNIYGDPKKGDYKVIPDVGEYVQGNILAATRRISNNQLLYDFKKRNLSHVTTSDQKFYVDGEHEVLDIEIFSNNEEIHDTTFTRQLHKYLRAQNDYYTELHNICDEIMKSGSNYSADVDYLYKRSADMIDTKKKWKEKDAAFGNMMIRIQVRRVCDLCKGQKITARHGNKSVLAQIRPDSEMPYTADGRPFDICYNLLGIINRTTAMAILEELVTAICWKCRKEMAKTPTFDGKVALLFGLIRDFNEEEYQKYYNSIFLKLSREDQERFIEDTIRDGIYIHEKPMYADTPLFMRLFKIMDKYDWIEQDDVYINKWGRRIRCLRPMIVGYMYVLKLKQSDRRGYSSRNSGAIDITGLPTRRYKSRSHLEQTSSTAIRFGEFETLNFSIGLGSEDIAAFHAIYRTSIKGRRDLLKAVATNKPIGPALDDVYVSRVAEIFTVYFKSMGIGVKFLDDDDVLKPMNDDTIAPHQFGDRVIMCTEYQYFILQKEQEIRERILDENPIMTKTLLEASMKKIMKEEFSVNNIQYSEDGRLLLESIEPISA